MLNSCVGFSLFVKCKPVLLSSNTSNNGFFFWCVLQLTVEKNRRMIKKSLLLFLVNKICALFFSSDHLKPIDLSLSEFFLIHIKRGIRHFAEKAGIFYSYCPAPQYLSVRPSDLNPFQLLLSI